MRFMAFRKTVRLTAMPRMNITVQKKQACRHDFFKKQACSFILKAFLLISLTDVVYFSLIIDKYVMKTGLGIK